MREVILTSHGHLAEGMYSAVKMILGTQSILSFYDLDHNGEPDNIMNLIKEKIKQNPENEYIIFTDINNGSVHHQMLQLCLYQNVYVQTGMCLSMVLEVLLSDCSISMKDTVTNAVKISMDNMQGYDYESIRNQLEKEDELW